MASTSVKYIYHYVFFLIVLSLELSISLGLIKTFRERFTRIPSKRLSALPAKQPFNGTIESCAESCVKETSFLCKSFEVDNVKRHCILYSVDSEDQDVHFISDNNRDHYGGAYTRLFDRTPKHKLYTWMDAALQDVSVEQCARICILEKSFKCQAFNYHPGDKICRLTERTAVDSHGIIDELSEDYYRRKPENDLAQFINYGQAALKTMSTIEVYQNTIRGIPVDQCATKCLIEMTYHCVSFDYIHDNDMSTCHLSKYVSGNVYGLRNVEQKRVNHYEKIEDDLAYFYPTPYSILLGNNLKTYKFVTPNRCARSCLEEEGFVCRSFDYQIKEGTCQLSDKTGSDVGGLYHEGTEETHHFEMKPILVCGGNLTNPVGDFASPNWPRNYAHHERCEWNITVPKNKVISFRFLKVDFGLQPGAACNENNDRLIIEEQGSTQCVTPNTRLIITKTNEAKAIFHSNSHVDAQGFRAFYEAEWTCDAHLNDAPGDFASPKWPMNYPSTTQCSWRISAPASNRIKLYFTSFQLEENDLGHCTDEIDHVKIQDGGTINSPKIGLYCGKRDPFIIKSSGTDMFIQFKSDRDRVNQGFHATFVFEKSNDTVVVSEPTLPKKGNPVDLDKGTEATNDDSDEEIDDKGVKYYDSGSDEKSSDENEIEQEEDKAGNNPGHNDSVSGKMSPSREEISYKEYKTAMWAIISLLIIMLLALAVILFLVWRHYERKLRHFGEIIKEENDMSPEEVPLQLTTFATSKPNNELLGNEVDVCGANNASQQGACGGNDINFGKYSKENIKNVNLDTKYHDDFGEKCNLTVSVPKSNVQNAKYV